MTRNIAATSLVTRDAAVSLIRVPGTTDVVVSTQSVPGMVGNVMTWAQVTGFRSEEGDGPADVMGSGIQIGADVALGPNVVAGLSFGHTVIDASDGLFNHDGTLTYLQPYLAYRSGDWHGSASLTYGRGDYDQTSFAGSGSAETELVALTLQGGYDFSLNGGLTVTPTLGLIHGREEVTGTSGTLAAAGVETYEFTQTSVGARMTYDYAGGQLFAGLHADHLTHGTGTLLTDDLLSEDGWSGRVEFGGSTDLGGRFGLDTNLEVSGLGADMQTVSGGLRIAFTF